MINSSEAGAWYLDIIIDREMPRPISAFFFGWGWGLGLHQIQKNFFVRNKKDFFTLPSGPFNLFFLGGGGIKNWPHSHLGLLSTKEPVHCVVILASYLCWIVLSGY